MSEYDCFRIVTLLHTGHHHIDSIYTMCKIRTSTLTSCIAYGTVVGTSANDACSVLYCKGMRHFDTNLACIIHVICDQPIPCRDKT